MSTGCPDKRGTYLFVWTQTKNRRLPAVFHNLRKKGTSPYAIDKFFYGLIDGQHFDEKAARKLLEINGHAPGDELVVMTFHPSGARLKPLESYLSHQLRSLFDCVSFCSYDGALIAIVNITKSKESVENLEVLIGPFLAQNELKCGISDTYVEYLQTRWYYVQATQAVLLGEGDDTQVFYRLRNQLVSFAASSVLEKLPWNLLCSQALIALIEHDKTSRVSYCDTLRTYLECDLSAGLASKRLHIHRNTFLARLERVKRVMGLDTLSDPAVQLELMLSFHIADRNLSGGRAP